MIRPSDYAIHHAVSPARNVQVALALSRAADAADGALMIDLGFDLRQAAEAICNQLVAHNGSATLYSQESSL